VRVEERALLNEAKNLTAKPRVRHAAIAIVVAALTAIAGLFLPLDITIWALQSKFASDEPSGSIVLVTDERNAASNSIVATNRILFRAIENLDKAGADKIVIDTPLRASSDAATDRRLRRAISGAGDRAYIAAPFSSEVTNLSLRRPNAERFTNTAPAVSSDMDIDFLDYVWSLESTYMADGERRPAAWRILAGEENSSLRIHPDYRMRPSDLPHVEIAELAAGNETALAQVKGKRVLIANLGGDDRTIHTPGGAGRKGTSAHVSAIAAETAIRGEGFFFSALSTLSFFGLVLLILAIARVNRRTRRVGYAIWLAQIVGAFAVVPTMGDRISLADALFMGLLYGCFRATANYRRRHLFIDTQSRLPNFTAFRRDLEAQGSLNAAPMSITMAANIWVWSFDAQITPICKGTLRAFARSLRKLSWWRKLQLT